jgi:hypothetical protein
MSMEESTRDSSLCLVYLGFARLQNYEQAILEKFSSFLIAWAQKTHYICIIYRNLTHLACKSACMHTLFYDINGKFFQNFSIKIHFRGCI